MSSYSLDINGPIGLSDYSSINDYINILEGKDSIDINMNLDNRENMDIICDILNRTNFEIDVKEKVNSNKYHILALKK